MTHQPTLHAELDRLEREAELYRSSDRARLLTAEQRDTLRMVEGRIRRLRIAIGATDD